MEPTFKQQKLAYFDSLTPDYPAYWSPKIFDIMDDQYEHIISKRGADEFERLKTMEWNEVLVEYVRWWIKGVSMTHVVSSDFNTGNSSPLQYDWYPHGFSEVACMKMIEKYKDRIKLDKPNDQLEFNKYGIDVERDLGYGHSVSRSIWIQLDFYLSTANKKIRPVFKPKVTCSGNAGFYDEFAHIAKDMQAEFETLKKDPIFKTDLTEFDTYPDITSYKDKHDQLGIINAFSRWDTLGTGRNIKFNKNYIEAYKDAAAYCPGIPRVEYNDDLKTCVYNGKTFTAAQVDDICCEEVPDNIHFITQGVREVLVHKYGLLPILLEDRFSPAEIIRSHVHWIHTKYHMPIDPELQALIDQYKVELWK